MQEAVGTGFEVSHEKQHVRLLELPPDLLQLLTSEEPPLLQLKSSTSNTSRKETNASHHAVLCTSQSTFQVRQVQSSNSVFIVQPSMKTGQCGDQDQKEAVVNAFAQCATTLELIPSHESSIAHLARALPVDDKGGIIDPRDSRTDAAQPRDDYFADLAFSAGELETAWVEICGFEHEGQAWRPNPAVLLALWKTILTNVTANGLDLEKRILVEELMAFAVEDGYKEELLHAVVLRLRSDTDDATHQWTTIDRATCVNWVGTLILQSRAATDGIPGSLFLSEWRNQLPEPWRQYAELELLKDEFTTTGSGNLLPKVSHVGVNGVPETGSTTNKKLGKWHEKFKSARN